MLSEYSPETVKQHFVCFKSLKKTLTSQTERKENKNICKHGKDLKISYQNIWIMTRS